MFLNLVSKTLLVQNFHYDKWNKLKGESLMMNEKIF